MKRPVINDTTFGPEEVMEHRKLIIELRDGALKQNDFQWAVILSVTVGLLNAFATLLKEQDK